MFSKEHTKHLLHVKIHSWPRLKDHFTNTSCPNHVKCIVTEVLILICWDVWTTVWARGKSCVEWVWSSFLENRRACVLSPSCSKIPFQPICTDYKMLAGYIWANSTAQVFSQSVFFWETANIFVHNACMHVF